VTSYAFTALENVLKNAFGRNALLLYTFVGQQLWYLYECGYFYCRFFILYLWFKKQLPNSQFRGTGSSNSLTLYNAAHVFTLTLLC